MSGRELRGGTKTVEREPTLEVLLRLSMDKIVLIDPVGERVMEEDSGMATGRLTASLYEEKECQRFINNQRNCHKPNPVDPFLSLQEALCG